MSRLRIYIRAVCIVALYSTHVHAEVDVVQGRWLYVFLPSLAQTHTFDIHYISHFIPRVQRHT